MASSHGAIQIIGTHGQVSFRVHHNHMVMSTNNSVMMSTQQPGLIDHNFFDDQTSSGLSGIPIYCEGDPASQGYLDWQDSTGLGTNLQLIAEANYIHFQRLNNTEGFFDGYNGCKITARYNTEIGNEMGGYHGTDTNTSRSGVVNELYGNYVSNSTGTVLNMTNPRGGVSMIWNNTLAGSTSWTGVYLQYLRVGAQNPNSALFGIAGPGLNWTPVSATTSNSGAVQMTLNAPAWAASHAYAAHAVVQNSGNNYQTNSSCTSGGSGPTTSTYNGTQSDGGCTWTNVAGVTTASPNPGVAAGFLSTAPDTTCTSGVSCTYYFDNTNGTYPFRDQPCVGHNQVVTPCYAWLNVISGSPGTVFYVAGANTNIVNNRDYYDYVASFTGATGTGSGLFSAIPSSCTPDVGYFATDQNTLYVCTSTNTWTAIYEPYTYPHPLTGGGSTPGWDSDIFSGCRHLFRHADGCD